MLITIKVLRLPSTNPTDLFSPRSDVFHLNKSVQQRALCQSYFEFSCNSIVLLLPIGFITVKLLRVIKRIEMSKQVVSSAKTRTWTINPRVSNHGGYPSGIVRYATVRTWSHIARSWSAYSHDKNVGRRTSAFPGLYETWYQDKHHATNMSKKTT